MGVPRLLRHGLGPLRRHHPGGGVIERVCTWPVPGTPCIFATALGLARRRSPRTCPHRAGVASWRPEHGWWAASARHPQASASAPAVDAPRPWTRGTGPGRHGTGRHRVPPTGPAVSLTPRRGEAAEREALTPSVCTPGARGIARGGLRLWPHTRALDRCVCSLGMRSHGRPLAQGSASAVSALAVCAQPSPLWRMRRAQACTPMRSASRSAASAAPWGQADGLWPCRWDAVPPVPMPARSGFHRVPRPWCVAAGSRRRGAGSVVPTRAHQPWLGSAMATTRR